MKKIFLAIALIGGASVAQAANTLSLSSCSSGSATATWSVDSGASSYWIEVTGVSDNTSLHIYDLSSASGSQSLNWAATVGDSSNAALSLVLNDGSTTVSATCP